MGFLNVSFDGYNYGKLEGLCLVYLLVSTDVKVLGSVEGIKLGSTDGRVLSTTLGNVDGINLVLILQQRWAL